MWWWQKRRQSTIAKTDVRDHDLDFIITTQAKPTYGTPRKIKQEIETGTRGQCRTNGDFLSGNTREEDQTK